MSQFALARLSGLKEGDIQVRAFDSHSDVLKAALGPVSDGPLLLLTVHERSEFLVCYKAPPDVEGQALCDLAEKSELEIVLSVPLQFSAAHEVKEDRLLKRFLLEVALPPPKVVPPSLRLTDMPSCPNISEDSEREVYWLLELYEENSLHNVLEQLKRVGCATEGFEMRFELGELLGEGGFSQVFYAEDIRTGEPVAAKMVTKEPGKDDLALRTEVCLLLRAQHPSVLKLHGLYLGMHPIIGSMVWIIVTEFAGGGELFDRVRTLGRMTEPRAADIICQLLGALGVLHDLGIVHRDIKTENVILMDAARDEVKLVDFGLATPIADGKAMMMRCGTPGYVAPEVLRQEVYGRKVDCFSTGVLLYILLVGSGPFRGKNEREVLSRNIRCKVNLNNLTHLSADAVDLVLRLLSSQPSLRPTARRSLEHIWFTDMVPPKPKAQPAAKVTRGRTSGSAADDPSMPSLNSLYVEGGSERGVMFTSDKLFAVDEDESEMLGEREHLRVKEPYVNGGKPSADMKRLIVNQHRHYDHNEHRAPSNAPSNCSQATSTNEPSTVEPSMLTHAVESDLTEEEPAEDDVKDGEAISCMSGANPAYSSQAERDEALDELPMLKTESPIFADMQATLDHMKAEGIAPSDTIVRTSSVEQRTSHRLSGGQLSGGQSSGSPNDSLRMTNNARERVSGGVYAERFTERYSSRQHARISVRTSHHFTCEQSASSPSGQLAADPGAQRMSSLDWRRSTKESQRISGHGHTGNSHDYEDIYQNDASGLNGEISDDIFAERPAAESRARTSKLSADGSSARSSSSANAAGGARIAVRALRPVRSLPSPSKPEASETDPNDSACPAAPSSAAATSSAAAAVAERVSGSRGESGG